MCAQLTFITYKSAQTSCLIVTYKQVISVDVMMMMMMMMMMMRPSLWFLRLSLAIGIDYSSLEKYAIESSLRNFLLS